ncbi:unnamed protein product, partial [Amoebophrya sp. A120]
SKFCEHRSCEWNTELSVSTVPANDIFVSLVLYRSSQVSLENALGHWSINLYKLLRYSGQRPIKLQPVFEPALSRPKFPLVANAGIWCSFLASGVMEEPLPDYDNAIEPDERTRTRTEVVPNILDAAALRAGGEQLLPVRIRVDYARNLPRPWRSRSDLALSATGKVLVKETSRMKGTVVDGALFVE